MSILVEGKIDTFGTGAERSSEEGKGRFDLISMPALWRMAKHYELGDKAHPNRNWEKGIPVSRCVSAAFRHLMKYVMGWKDEDHLAAVVWNVFAIMHFEALKRHDLFDMPMDLESLMSEVAACASEEAKKDES